MLDESMDVKFEKEFFLKPSEIISLGVNFDDYNDLIWTISAMPSLAELQNFRSMGYREIKKGANSILFSTTIDVNHELILQSNIGQNGRESVNVLEIRRVESLQKRSRK